MNASRNRFDSPRLTHRWIMPVLLAALFTCFPGMATAQYMGAESCADCHSSQFGQWLTSGHRFILMNSNSARHRPLPLPQGESWDDISYTVGGHKTRVAYLDSQGYLLSDEFNLNTGEWYEAHPGSAVPYDCAACHTTGYEESGNQDGLPGFVGTFALPGVQCEHCHGPGMAMEPGSTDPAFCGTCHNHGPDDTVAAGGGFILSEGQYNEFLASPHSDAGLGCVSCHSPHQTVEFGIDATCSGCHSDEAAAYAGSLMDIGGIDCVDCHMPPATVSAGPLGPHEGDMKSHIFNINTDPSANMFTPDGSQLALTGGEGAVTLDFVCQRCHMGTSLDVLSKFAEDFHESDVGLEHVGLNPGLSGTWWDGGQRSGEGFLIEFAYAGPVLYFFGSFYTYDSEGNMVWLTFQPATGVPDSGTTVDVIAYITEGGRFGEGNPGVAPDTFGTGSFTFDTCTTGSVSISPNQAYLDLGFTNLSYGLSRLLQAGVDCPTFENTSAMPVAAQ